MASHRFRDRYDSIAKWLLACLLLVAGGTVAASDAGRLSSDASDRRSTIPNDVAAIESLRRSDIETIAVQHEGWSETLLTFARLKIYELTGRETVAGQYPVYTLLSLVYQPELWVDAKILPVEHPRIAEVMALRGKWVSPREVVTSPHVQALIDEINAALERRDEYETLTRKLNAVEQIRRFANRPGIAESVLPPGASRDEITALAGDAAALKKELARREELGRTVAAEKAMAEAGSKLINRAKLSQTLAEQLLVVPDPESLTGAWVAPTAGGMRIVHASEGELAERLRTAGREFDSALAASMRNGAGDAGSIARKFLGIAEAAPDYPSRAYRNWLNRYVSMNPFSGAAALYGVAAALFGCFAFFKARTLRLAATGVLLAGLLAHTAGEVLRLYLTGHMPVSNMFESITFCSFAALVVGTCWELATRRGLAGMFAAVFGLAALIAVSLMPLHETRIHPLRAVLNSYWLNIHVTMMLTSYGTFAISAFFAAGYLVKSLAGRESLAAGAPLVPLEQMEEFAYRLVQFGWPLLTVGVMLGAVWADTAWGRYWGWDPKETWALITWIAYTIYLHTRMILGWRGRAAALSCLLGFVSVMITWLGVSYLPWFSGGLHSYASPT